MVKGRANELPSTDPVRESPTSARRSTTARWQLCVPGSPPVRTAWSRRTLVSIGSRFTIKAVDIREASSDPHLTIVDQLPSLGVRECLTRCPVLAARAKEREIVGEMPIDGQPRDRSFSREGGNGGRGRADGAVQANGGLNDPLSSLSDVVRSLAHPVLP